MVKERLKFFIRFKRNNDNNSSYALAKQEKLDAIKSSYTSINDEQFKNIFTEYERNSRIYWIRRSEFYKKYFDSDRVTPIGNSSSTQNLVTVSSVSISSNQDTEKDLTVKPSSTASNGKLIDLIYNLGKFLQRKLTSHGVFKTIVILILAFLCFSQCYTMIVSYFAYPSSVNLYEHIPSSLLETLPGITICNNNR